MPIIPSPSTSPAPAPAPAPVKSGRILSAGAVRVSRDRAPISSVVEDQCAGARVETRLKNGVVSEIIVTCDCGRQTVIHCDYSELAQLKQ